MKTIRKMTGALRELVRGKVEGFVDFFNYRIESFGYGKKDTWENRD